ncbi:hypothetical protein [Streptomyces sp. NPDC088752]|uniref:hypothetical protein n=1 Tax=Streptomyces sp. NPDC088752 TaxID=3154963 RepID=UPI00343CEE50
MEENREVNVGWIPVSGFQIRKAGVQFDAVRVDGEDGRRLADWMETLTGGDPGPVVIEANGRRGVTRFSAGPAHVSYVPVPALTGRTWPLAWRCPPTGPGRFVHPLLLWRVVTELLERPGPLLPVQSPPGP